MREPPSFSQIVGGIFIAALAAAATGGVIFSFLLGPDPLSGLTVIPFVLAYALPFGFPIAFLLAFAFGLPAYLLLARYHRLRWWSATAAGALIGTLPGMVLLCFTQGSTAEAVGIAQFTAGCGALGGLAFWAILRRALGTS
jgi:hypothetical protein